jgi:16S rRNA (uracil1498-N3)-methyltransferase
VRGFSKTSVIKVHTPRIFVDQSIKLSDVVTLDGSKAHHLAHVLKMRVADPLIIFNGSGGEFRAKVIDVKKDRLQVHIEQHDPVNRESELRITLLLAVLKKDPMRQALQRATELGVSEIIPVWTQHLSDRKSHPSRRVETWQSIVEGASEQSGRTQVPNIVEPLPFQEVILENQSRSKGLKLIAHLNQGPLKLSQEPFNPAAGVTLAIGPEGGFSETEIEIAVTAGFLPFSIGPRILRAETAPAALLAYLQTRIGDY